MISTTRAAILVLTCATSAQAQSTTTVLRATGEHTPAVGDTADSARQLAQVDARIKLLQATLARVQADGAVKALRLRPGQLEAYVAVIVEMEEEPQQPRPAAGRGPVRVPMLVRLDHADVVRRMTLLRKDQDATQSLVEAWTEAQTLHQQLASQTRRRSGLPPDEASAAVHEQLQTMTRLAAKDLAARATAALARTEESTVGGRAPTAAGRTRAKALLEAALAMAPDSPDARSAMGDLLVDDGQPEAAEAEFRKAVTGPQSSSLDRAKLAEAMRLQGKFTEAAAELRDIIRLDPAFARAHSDLGLILRAEKKLPEALAAYRESIRLDPDAIDAHNGLAVALANSGQVEEAIVEFREIIRIDPDSAIGYYNLAYALAEVDRDVESAAALREVIRINPNHYNARYNLGELFRLEGKYDDSVTQFREYLKLAPDAPQNRRNIQRARDFIAKLEGQ
jgi:tetratricopeptide (TPR) repeat protein